MHDKLELNNDDFSQEEMLFMAKTTQEAVNDIMLKTSKQPVGLDVMISIALNAAIQVILNYNAVCIAKGHPECQISKPAFEDMASALWDHLSAQHKPVLAVNKEKLN